MQVDERTRLHLIELVDDQESDLSVTEMARCAGVDFDTAMGIIAEHLAKTGGSLSPRIRRRRLSRGSSKTVVRVRTWSLF